MASGVYCKECNIQFHSHKSLEVHLQYHRDNIVKMWMPGTEDRPRETPVASAHSPAHQDMTQMIGNDNLGNNNVNNVPPPFPAPSPMQYEYKLSPGLASPAGMQSPPAATVPQGPSSGHGQQVPFPQQSPGYFMDYGAPQNQPQSPQPMHQLQSYQQVGYMNGDVYDVNFYGRNTAPSAAMARYHPYTGRSPVPTPSPGGHLEIKEEPRVAESSDILDLDSQKVLSSNAQNAHQNQNNLSAMWRPHEQYSQNPGLPSVSLTGMPNLQQTNTYNLPIQANQPPRQLPLSNGPAGFPNNGGSIIGGVYHNQGFGTGVVPGQPVNPSPTNFASQVPSPTPRDPPTEFAPNVKRPKSYKCEDCNKWFTSQGHLKRHYNTTLHKTMCKNAATASASAPTPQSTTPELTRPPILSPGAKSIGDASTTSSHDDESNLSTSDTLDGALPTGFPSTPSAFQPPVSSIPTFSSIPQGPPSGSNSHSLNTMSPMSPMPQYNMNHNFMPEPVHTPTTYHGHFSANPTSFPSQPVTSAPVSTIGNNFFHANNYNFNAFSQPQGGLQGPGYHMTDMPGPSSALDGYSYRMNTTDRLGNLMASFPNDRMTTETLMHHQHQERLGEEHQRHMMMDNMMPQDRLMHNGALTNEKNDNLNLPTDPASVPSPEVTGDTGSEASMDSSESSASPVEPPGHRCQDCHKTFNKMCYLTQHRSTYHEGERPFKCNTCGKRFTDETVYTEHQSKHAGEKPYKCEVCPKQFNHKTDLRRHMCLHTGEKPFSCEQCGKGFIRKDHMLKHFQTHRKKALQAANNAAAAPHHPPPLLHPQAYPGTHLANAPLGHPPHVASRGHPPHPPAVY